MSTEKNKVGRPKGTRKTGGRKKGTPNKVTSDLRTFVSDMLNDNRAQIQKDMAELEPYERLRIYERLLSYVLPKQTQNDNNINLDIESMTDTEVEILAGVLIKKIEN